VKKDLEGDGFFVDRRPVSQFPDLICLRPGEPCLVECKTHRQDFSQEERQKLMELGMTYGADCLLAYKDGRSIVYESVYKRQR
jgi:Holliday junction resolvase